MERLVKIYIPLLAVFLYFSGFFYIAVFFQFLGLVGGYREFDLFQIGFFSFSVLYELIVFRDFGLSSKILALIGFLFFIHALPDFQIRLKSKSPSSISIVKLLGQDNLPLLPSPLRVIIGSALSFYILFDVSGAIGKIHACDRLTMSKSSVTLVGLNTESLSSDQRDFILSAQEKGELTEVWRTENSVYISKTIRDCIKDSRHLIVLGFDDFDFTITRRIN